MLYFDTLLICSLFLSAVASTGCGCGVRWSIERDWKRVNESNFVTVRVTPEVSINIYGGTIEQMAALMSSLESHCDRLRNGIHSVLTDENFTITVM